VTFYGILAIFPAIAALVSIYGMFADPASIEQQLEASSGILPGGAVEIIGEEIKRIASQGRSTLGASFAVGLAVSLWSANAGIKSIFDVLNVVYGEEEKRGFIKLNAVSLAFTLAGILLVIVVFAGVAVLPVALSYLGLGGWTDTLVRILRWPLLFLFVATGIAILYRYGPSRTAARWRWVTWGSAFAALVWLITSMLFTWYVANFGTYNKTYGSLGAVIGFMIWIWISTIVVLIGAEIDAELERQTARDTTVGGDKPIGARGARAADTIGEATA
jgi:membrane protein